MRIGMLLVTKFPPDIRVEKEISTLRHRHDVALLCTVSGDQPAEEQLEGVRVHRVFSRWTRGLATFQLMRGQRSSLWHTEIRRFVTEQRIEVLHVHDLPLLATAQSVAEEFGIPVVVDLHENYPAILEVAQQASIGRTPSLGKLVSRFAVSIADWRAYERRAVPKADQVIVVVDEARDRLVDLGVPRERTTVVGNYAALNEYAASSATDSSSRAFRVVYAGGFDSTRDLRTVVRAVAELAPSQYPDLEVVLVGGRGREFNELQDFARSLGVTERVHIKGWIPLADVERLIASCQVGLVPHAKSEHTDSTVPHKLFQYMWQRLPVIVSDCLPLQRIVTEAECGLFYQAGDHQMFAQKIAEIYQRDDRGKSLGDAGRQAVRDTFNWSAAGDALLEVYDRLTRSSS